MLTLLIVFVTHYVSANDLTGMWWRQGVAAAKN